MKPTECNDVPSDMTDLERECLSQIDTYVEEWADELYRHFSQEGNVEKAAGTCKPGQTASATGCTPASGGEGGRTGQTSSAQSSRSSAAGAGARVVATLGDAAAKYADAKEAAKRLGKAGFAKLPPKLQKGIARAWGWAKYVEHKLMTGFTKARELAQAVGKERGMSPDQVERLGRVLAAADLITAWTVNMPATIVVTGSVTAGKVASWVPVASLAYVAYSTARNPLAVVRAARSVVKGGDKHKGKKQMDQQQFAKALAARVESLGKNWDWYLALLHAALDETGGDVAKSLAAADAALKKQPAPPADEPLSEEDLALVPKE